MGKRVFITVAEVSGDQHAANLTRALREIDPTLIIEGHGGPAMQAAGVMVHHETVRDAAMSFHGAKRAFEMFRLFKWTKGYFDQQRPDLQICIDSPDMNLHFAKIAAVRGIPVLYYIAPQVWAWREWRIKKLRKCVKKIACILPFEEEYFRGHGIDTTFVGHPLFDHLKSDERTQPAEYVGDRPPVVGLLPGSRKSEATANFPHLLDVARRIRTEFSEAKFLVPTTPATTPVVKEVLEHPDFSEIRGVTEFRENAFDELVPKCDLCVTVSGTATLHVAVHGVPMIVVYRGSMFLWKMIGQHIVKARTYSLVNLLSDEAERIVPEFIPWAGSNGPLAACAIDYLKNPEKLADQRRRITRLVERLDQPGASTNVARMAMGMMG